MPDTKASSDDDDSSADEEDDVVLAGVKRKKGSEIRLTGIVWKRRSGLGKYSSTAAWEDSSVIIDKDFKPLAGTSAMRINTIDEPAVNDIGHVFAGWMPGKSNEVQVRSHGYKSTRAKVASPGELYECTNMDIFEGPKRYPDMTTRVTLPDVSFPGDPATKTWNAPDRFIISVRIRESCTLHPKMVVATPLACTTQ